MVPAYTATAHVNPNFMRQWSQQAQYVAPRANVHVNPAFFPPQTVEMPSTNKIIVNPRFFPQVQPAEKLVESVPVLPLKIESLTIPVTATCSNKPSPVRHPVGSLVNDRSKLARLNFSHTAVKNRYKWRKVDSPSKSASSTKQTLYKLVRKAPALKSPKLSALLAHRPRYDTSKWLSPPKMTSTPIESPGKGIKSRFRLDNRKKKMVNKSTNKSTIKATLKSKVNQPARNKCWRPAAMAKWYSHQRSAAKNSFTNFKSPLSRSQHIVLPRQGKIQRLVAAVKPTSKTTKKAAKPAKTKTRKRYYEESGSGLEEANSILGDDDMEIGVKPANSKKRTPLGILPSFITL